MQRQSQTDSIREPRRPVQTIRVAIQIAAALVCTVMRVQNHAGLSSAELAEIESELCGQRTLAEVITWGSKQPAGKLSPRIITGVVVQDEFTHDIFVPWGERLVLVYGAT